MAAGFLAVEIMSTRRLVINRGEGEGGRRQLLLDLPRGVYLVER